MTGANGHAAGVQAEKVIHETSYKYSFRNFIGKFVDYLWSLCKSATFLMITFQLHVSAEGCSHPPACGHCPPVWPMSRTRSVFTIYAIKIILLGCS